MYANLKTRYTYEGVPHSQYPRPTMRRDSYLTLNGEWDFAIALEGEEPIYDKRIVVPFAPESMASGIGEVYDEKYARWYRREVVLAPDFDKGRVILHLGSVDQRATIYLNGEVVCEHVGGYMPFEVDISEYLSEKNILEVKAVDILSDYIEPYGKQKVDRGGMWYTPVSGIWGSVWLESVPSRYISSLKVNMLEGGVSIEVGGVESAEILLTTPDGVEKYEVIGGKCDISIPTPRLWSPSDPYLYRYEVVSDEDRVQSYFAIRHIEIKEIGGVPRITLNGEPIFFHAVLDQGYYSDGIYTPVDLQAYTDDIEYIKSLGFNTIRKHIKVEPEYFYYECDRLGMIVWQDMVNNGKYSFFKDTVLPTIGFLGKNDKNLHPDKKSREAFVRTMLETISLLDKHPSVCYYTIFNEGWGQFDSQSAYTLVKSIEKTRIIDTTSGWYRCGDSDVDSRHIYFRKLKIKPSTKPVVISEFGGIVYSVEGHVYNLDKSYGYGKVKSREGFVEKLRALYIDEVLPLIKKGLCATVYTQLSDIEDEINGLITYDREVKKIYPKEFEDISRMLYQEIRR